VDPIERDSGPFVLGPTAIELAIGRSASRRRRGFGGDLEYFTLTATYAIGSETTRVESPPSAQFLVTEIGGGTSRSATHTREKSERNASPHPERGG
jgi:hypothetical protein